MLPHLLPVCSRGLQAQLAFTSLAILPVRPLALVFDHGRAQGAFLHDAFKDGLSNTLLRTGSVSLGMVPILADPQGRSLKFYVGVVAPASVIKDD